MAKAAVTEKPKAGGAAKAGAGPAKGASGAAAEPVGMEIAELKRMLRFAQEEPVRVAFALGADGKAIVVMDKRKQPRALEKELKEGAPDSKNHRFGMASVDPEQPKLVRFTVNKASNGMGRKLAVALKGTGYNKVEIGSEDGAPPERHEEKDEEDALAEPEPAQGGLPGPGQRGQEAPVQDRAGPAAFGTEHMPDALGGAKVRDSQPAIPDAARQAPRQDAPAREQGPNAGQLVAKLTPKVRQMLEVVGKDPSRKAALAQLATDAQTSLRGAMLTLKREDLDKASVDIDLFCKAVDDAAKALPAPANANGANGRAGPDGTAPQDRSKDRKQPNAAQLAATLTKMAQKAVPAMRADPSRATPIKDALTRAHASLKVGDLAATLMHMDGLGGLLGPEAAGLLGKVFSGDGHQAGEKAGDVAADRKLLGRLAAEWHQAEEQVRAGVKALKAELDKLYDGDPAAAQMEKDFAVHVDAIFAKFDGTLAKDVQAAASARTAAEMGAVKADLRRAVSGFIDFLEHDSILLMDENPLVDIKIVPTCEAALKSMLASLG